MIILKLFVLALFTATIFLQEITESIDQDPCDMKASLDRIVDDYCISLVALIYNNNCLEYRDVDLHKLWLRKIADCDPEVVYRCTNPMKIEGIYRQQETTKGIHYSLVSLDILSSLSPPTKSLTADELSLSMPFDPKEFPSVGFYGMTADLIRDDEERVKYQAWLNQREAASISNYFNSEKRDDYDSYYFMVIHSVNKRISEWSDSDHVFYERFVEPGLSREIFNDLPEQLKNNATAPVISP